MQWFAARSMAAAGLLALGAALLPWISTSRDAIIEPYPDKLGETIGEDVGTFVVDPVSRSPAAMTDSANVTNQAVTVRRVPVGDVGSNPAGTEKELPPAAGLPSRTMVRSGRLNLDPNRLAKVHARFGGQVIAIGQTEMEAGQAIGQKSRPLQFGDAVKKGELLAVVWSREVGEKKSELLQAMSQVLSAERLLLQAKSLAKGPEADHHLSEAERHLKAAIMAVKRIERTLQSWKMSDDEIQEVQAELQRLQASQSAGNPQLERAWGEVRVRAPFDGVVLERNVSVGEIVDNRIDLFKIGDVSVLGVTIDVYEEDLPALESLGSESRRWLVRLKSEPAMRGIPGSFDVIAKVVDPRRHTISVIGTLDNSQGVLRAGQFVTAEICLK